MELKILGSVSPYCKNDCNCPGYLVKTNDSKILLDAGNGISRNLSFPNDLNNLSIIISHLHKDHYGDLSAIGYVYQVHHKLGYIENKPILYIPTISEKEDSYDDYLFIKETMNDKFQINEYNADSLLMIDNVRISFLKTIHPILCYAIKINNLIYSADTGFKIKEDFINFAKDSDILLCESSFIKEHNAVNEGHLIAYQAALIAKEANVKRLILTHFWPEEDKIKYLNEAKEIFKNSYVAKEKDLYDL